LTAAAASSSTDVVEQQQKKVDLAHGLWMRMKFIRAFFQIMLLTNDNAVR
jgi:hypothetical protein